MNWYKKLLSFAAYRRRRRPYSGPPRYFGPMRLISFMGRPAIIGNTMKMDRNTLAQLGFAWQGNTSIDGTQLGDAPDNAINGAMIGSRPLSQEEIDMLAQNNVDVSMSATEFQPYNPATATPAQPDPEQQQNLENNENGIDNQMKEDGAQSTEENIQMLMELRSASGNYQDTRNVIKSQLNKLSDIMSNTQLSEEQAALREDFLRFLSTSHKYSFYNSILIFMQNRDATMVGGAKNKWEKSGRTVKEGESPIYIIAPIIGGKQKLSRDQYNEALNRFRSQGKSDAEAKKSIQKMQESSGRLVGFKDVPVYDISQTQPIEGWTDPETGKPPFDYQQFQESWRHKFNEPEERADAIWRASVAAMQNAGINVAQENTRDSGGWSSGGEVRIHEDSKGQRRVATLFHEWAHEVLHTSAEGRRKRRQEETPKNIIEAEAESTSWLLCQAFGLQGDPEHAARYMLLWKTDPKEIMDRQENIHKAYSQIYRAVNEQLDKMIGDKPQ